METIDHFSRLRRRFALEAKRVQYKSRQSNFLFSLFHYNGFIRYTALSLVLGNILCILSTTIYFLFIYNTRYQSELQFSVQNASFYNSNPRASQLGAAPDLVLIQNTQIAFEFLTSYDLFQSFIQDGKFIEIYSSDDIDFLSQFSPEWDKEKQFSYWKNLIDKNIQLPGGLIKVKYTAFNAENANYYNEFIIQKLTDKINSVNKNIFSLLIKTNLKQLEASQQLYLDSINNLSEGRQKFGQIEPLKLADDINRIATEINTALLLSKSELSTLNSQRLGTSPQAEIIEKRLIELNVELSNLKKLLTSFDSKENSVSIAETTRVISGLELKKNITEKLVQISFENYEISKQLSDITRSFIQVFVQPNIISISSTIDRLLLVLISSIICIFFTITLLFAINTVSKRL